MRVSKETYERLINNSMNYKQSKYHNKKTTLDGIKFDSIKERNYYIKLKMMQDLGKISELKLQVKFELQPGFEFQKHKIRPITYIADFTYLEDGKLHIVDTKGIRTDVYKLKKKMMMYKGYEIEEI